MQRQAWALILALSGCAEPVLVLADAPPKYAEHCAACHEAGAADAPRRGDVEDWAQRGVRGLPALVERVKTGTTAMPPRGLCYTCTDAEIEALARFVSGL